MHDKARRERRDQIEAAAYRVLEREGYAGNLMLAVAREAQASNETLYRWYGDKTGLFRALIERHAASIAERLSRALDQGDPLQALAEAGPMLLTMLVGDRAVALNRAAAADLSGTLGRALAEGGRGRIAPMVVTIVTRALAEGQLAGATPEELAETWLDLLIGDLQIRRVTGALAPRDASQIERRATRALEQLRRLYSPPG